MNIHEELEKYKNDLLEKQRVINDFAEEDLFDDFVVESLYSFYEKQLEEELEQEE